MKNFYRNRTNKALALINKTTLVVILALVFQLLYPLTVFATASSTSSTDTTDQEEVSAKIETGDATSGLTQENEINTNTTTTNASEEESEENLEDDTDSTSEDETNSKENQDNDENTENDQPDTEKDDKNATSTPNETDIDTQDAEQNSSSTEQKLETTGTSTATTTAKNNSTTTISGASKSELSTSTDNNATDTEMFATDNKDKSTSTASSTDEKSVEGDGDASQESESEKSDFSFQTTVNSSSTASSTNNATSSATTGNNEVSSSTTFITETGDAISYVDLVNVVNTNIVNSVGLIDFIRDVLGYKNFDMRDLFSDTFTAFNTAESTAACQTDCDPAALLVDLINQANIENNLSITANTGENSGENASGTINTGNAYASANVVNLANTNIVDSNYMLLVFNNFADMSGSLVLPNSDFFESLFQGGAGTGGSFDFNNSASVTNNATTVADTGNNTASGTDSVINTGNSVSSNSISNLINQNFVNTNNFSMLVRVQGDWSGEVFGLPEGMQWEDTGEGIRLFYGSGKEGSASQNQVNVTNNANISNNVSVYALTGDNHIKGAGNNTISTGNAYADSTIMNIANTNVIGSNWINLIFNIYGNWDGNLAFGQPDLWLGLKAETEKKKIYPTDDISYTYTIFNSGDTAARNVVLESKFPMNSLNFHSGTQATNWSNGTSTWDIGTIEAGQTKEITVNTTVENSFGDNKKMPLPLSAHVYGDQPDANDEDNTDSLLLFVGENDDDEEHPRRTFPAKFIIEKSADKSQAVPGDTVKYTIKLTNRGGQLFDSLLVDVLRDSDGNILNEQTWPLETIKNGENIDITYTINLPEDMPEGVYTNTAQIVGLEGSTNVRYQNKYQSPTAQHELTVGESETWPLLGHYEVTPVCSPYLTTYLRYGQPNNTDEVVKLQQFLRVYVSTDVTITGVFDLATKQAVKDFQEQYATNILAPWGMIEGSGYVYYTTQKKINEIMCDDKVEFPLTQEQENEINFFNFQNHQPGAETPLFGNTTPDLNLARETSTPDLSATTQNSPANFSFKATDTTHSHLYSQVDNWLVLLNNKHTASLY